MATTRLNSAYQLGRMTAENVVIVIGFAVAARYANTVMVTAASAAAADAASAAATGLCLTAAASAAVASILCGCPCRWLRKFHYANYLHQSCWDN